MQDVSNYSLKFRSGSILKAEGSPDCGKGLLLAGSPGSGKTALASVVAQHLVRSSRSLWDGVDRPVFFVTYPDYLLSLQRSFSTEESSLEKTALGAGLLVLDDLGKEHKTASGWSESVFDSLLRLRFDRGLPTLVTTNIPKSRFGIVYGEAMGSFVNECFTTLVVISPDGDRRLHG
jgi:DNA replication protein DnaC